MRYFYEFCIALTRDAAVLSQIFESLVLSFNLLRPFVIFFDRFALAKSDDYGPTHFGIFRFRQTRSATQLYHAQRTRSPLFDKADEKIGVCYAMIARTRVVGTIEISDGDASGSKPGLHTSKRSSKIRTCTLPLSR